MPNRNVIFAFFGGVMIGCATTYVVLRKTGKVANLIDLEAGISDEGEPAETEEGTPRSDTPSFDIKEKVNTTKTDYVKLNEKPSLESLAAKYEKPKETEKPEEDIDDEAEDEEDDEEEQIQEEIAEALMNHPGQGEYEEAEGFGHYILQLETGRKDNLIYLIPEEYLGEIYSVEDLVYYEGDDVLCDVLDAPVVDLTRVVGPALEYFGEFDDTDKVYIRNCHMGFEYEITRRHESFGAHIYGINETNEEAPKRKPRKPQGDEE